MHKQQRKLICMLLVLALMSACSKMPDHARYIPKDAVAVAGINLKGLSRKIAWSVITDSKLFKEMQDRISEKNTKDAMNGIEKAGIDFLNTLYVYVKTDNRFRGGNRITGIIPLSDAGQWEDYIKKVIPGVQITQHGGHKEASLGRDMYVGWSSNVLMIMNVMAPDQGTDMGSNGGTNKPSDATGISAEMEQAFSVTIENSIKGNKYFNELDAQGHDISFLLNYEKVMAQMGNNVAEKIGMNLQGDLWKDAAFTTGLDFEKGKITGDIHYFVPGMKDIGAELGSTNADKEMLDKLPGQNLDMLLSMHISTKGIKSIMEKLSLLGMANAGLSTQGLNTDNVLDAFTGDMAFAMNDFSLKNEKVTDQFMGQTIVHDEQKTSMSFTYVMKLNKTEEFQKLVKLAKDNGLPASGKGFVIPINSKDSVYILMNDKYAVASNKYVYASGLLDGSAKSGMAESPASGVYGHPTAFFLDFQQLLKNIDPSISHSAHDSAMISESKKLLSTVSFTGGGFKNDAFEYHLDINFMNKDENSILILKDFGTKMSDADKIKGNINP